MKIIFAILLCFAQGLTLGISMSSAATPEAKSVAVPRMHAVSDSELKILKQIDATYQAKAATMKVEKITKIPLLDQERKAKGQLWISAGKMRLELDGAEKSLLIVNKKNLWAITYPPAEFKDAALQVIKADTSTKKGRSQNLIAILSQGGLLKFFVATGVMSEADGSSLFFLTPMHEQVDFKRAQARVSADGKKLSTLIYWDDRDNETHLEFKDIKFEKKIDEKLFNYTPPANADVMSI